MKMNFPFAAYCGVALIFDAGAATTVYNAHKHAYGANIGWIHFENNGAPRVNPLTGALSGHAYSANCGWISLSNAFAYVQTDRLPPGADTDGDGIPDPWELTYTNSLTDFTATSDADGDGMSDLLEHGADTHPLDASDLLRITDLSLPEGEGSGTGILTWSSKSTRNYRVRYRTLLNSASIWQDATGLIEPDPGPTTSVIVPISPSSSERYFQVEALMPSVP